MSRAKLKITVKARKSGQGGKLLTRIPLTVEKMHELASEMEDRYGERYYGMRGGYYGRRDHGDWDDEMYGERRRRDSRGRYM